MPRRTTKAPANEGGGLSKILVAIALYAVAVLMIWLAVAPAQPDTAMGSISGVLRSVGGALAIGLAVIPAAVATRLIRSVKGNQMSIPHLICYIIVYLCVYAIFHAFFINTVLSTVSIRAYGNFVARSGGIGGGKLGAFLCYPLYKVIGVAGDIFAFLVVMVLALTGTGVIPAAVRRLAPIIADLRYRIDQRNKERESERLFAGADRPEKPTRKPSREDVFEDGRPGRDRRPQRPTRPETARPARETRPEREGRPEREAVRTVKPSAEPDVTVRKRRVNRMPEGRSVVDPDNIKMPSHTNRPPRGTVDVAQPAEAAPEKKPRPTRPVMGEVKLGDDPVASRLNRNKVRQPRAAAPVVPEPEQPMIVDVSDEEDDLPPFDVEPVAEKPVRAPRRSGRLVEEPSALALPLDDDEDAPAPKPADDLTITPDSCDVIETSGEPEPGKPPVKRSPLKVILGEDEPEPYNYPPLDLMRLTEQEQVDHQSGDLEKADLLIETLEEFGIH
ncbi:MAG: hypothetical protein MJ099_06060, partial [Clostridia bacterium]|nr:hypothetical protein [Clostridia bacterium]